jgi:O-antigen/teichoic acid export membrane protein
VSTENPGLEPPPPTETPSPAFMDKQTLATKAAGSIISTVGAQVIQMLLGFANAAVLTIWLGPSDYGVFGMANTVVGFIAIFGDIGLSSALIRHPQIGPSEETTGFVLALLGGAAMAAIALASAPAIGIYYRNRQAGVMAAVLAVNFLTQAVARISIVKLNRSLSFRKLSWFGIVGSVASVTTGVVAAKLGAGAWSLLFAALAAPLALSIAYLRAAPPKLTRHGYSRNVARHFATLGAQMSGFTLAVSLAALPATVLLGRVADAAAVGLFSLGFRLIVMPIQKIAAAFGAVFLPSFAQIEPQARARAYQLSLRALVMVTAPVAVGFFVVADEIVTILPSRWHSLTPMLRWFAIGCLLEPVGAIPLTRIVADGRGRLLLWMGILAIPISWISYAIAAWIGGATAFVIAWSAIYLILPPIYLMVAAEDARECLRSLRSLGPPLGSALAMGVLVELVQAASRTSGTKAGLAIGVVTGFVTYILAARTFMRQDFDRIQRSLISSLRNRLA